MKRRTCVIIIILIGLLCGVFIPTKNLYSHIMTGILTSTILLWIAIFSCLFSEKIDDWFE